MARFEKAPSRIWEAHTTLVIQMKSTAVAVNVIRISASALGILRVSFTWWYVRKQCFPGVSPQTAPRVNDFDAAKCGLPSCKKNSCVQALLAYLVVMVASLPIPAQGESRTTKHEWRVQLRFSTEQPAFCAYKTMVSLLHVFTSCADKLACGMAASWRKECAPTHKAVPMKPRSCANVSVKTLSQQPAVE